MRFFYFVWEVVGVFANFNVDDPSLSVCVCVSVRLSVASHVSETSEAIAITFNTVTVLVTAMHHVLIILILTFIRGHTNLNHKNNKCSIISKTIQAMPIKFVVKIVRLKV